MNGRDLIGMGFEPGPHFAAMIPFACEMEAAGRGREEIRAALAPMAPVAPETVPLLSAGKFAALIDAGEGEEAANVTNVMATMTELVRTPVVRSAAVMPDACPTGPVGTIPVGGVAVSEAIHPGMHSADICCSVMISVISDASPAAVLDRVHEVTHFGPGARRDQPFTLPRALASEIEANRFTKPHAVLARLHLGTQGDGNHFAFVGTLDSTGETALVTHHGSRGFGAKVYKEGMKIAERYRQRLSPETLKGNAWIPVDTQDGDDYWQALQIIRAWTKENHLAVHDALGLRVTDRFWNEHNFIFRKADGLFYHAKGATPAFKGWASDATDLTLIPLNMASPVLIARGSNNPLSLGFSPHGAGRSWSRTQHRKRLTGADAEIVAAETFGIDARFFCGVPDTTELPSAYKSAATIREQIKRYALAEIIDEVHPYGCIMAGDWERNAPWRTKAGSSK